MDNIWVLKRDNTKEPFDTGKMLRVCLAAGLEPNQAEEATNEVIDWLKTLTKTDVTSLELRDKLVTAMKRIHQPAAQMYVWYESTKDKPEVPPVAL